MNTNIQIQKFSLNETLDEILRLQKECYEKNNTHSSTLHENKKEGDLWCKRTFDGFSCWDATPASETAFQQCPDFIYGYDPRLRVYKSCTENGTWFRLPEANGSWTNYTTCINHEDLEFRILVNDIYVAGYSISAAALLISIAIFIYFRSLYCTRIRIHMHLFISFALNNILWIVWYRSVVNRVDVLTENKEWCQILHVLTNYFMVTTYLWMFCEGLHLHVALVVVFVRDDVAMRWFLAVGWGLSLLIVMVYATARYFTPGDTKMCWMYQSDAFWIITIPVVVSLFASFVFLVNVVRVLVTKLHLAPNQHASLAAKKAVRATLILIPLFGLHYLLIPFRPLPEAPGEKIYQIVSALLISLQGICVAVLFCFTNHDVMMAIKTHILRCWSGDDGIPMAGITGGESLMNTRENMV